MTARQPWDGPDYDRWLDSGLDALEDEPMSFDSECTAITSHLAELDHMRKVGYWDAAERARVIQSIRGCTDMLTDLMDQEAQARCI